jgi:hypothetical protein
MTARSTTLDNNSISRESCRREFETRFTADVMAAQHERIYLDSISTCRNGSLAHARFDEERSAASFYRDGPSRFPQSL